MWFMAWTRWYRLVSFCSSLLNMMINAGNSTRGNQKIMMKVARRRWDGLGVQCWRGNAAAGRLCTPLAQQEKVAQAWCFLTYYPAEESSPSRVRGWTQHLGKRLREILASCWAWESYWERPQCLGAISRTGPTMSGLVWEASLSLWAQDSFSLPRDTWAAGDTGRGHSGCLLILMGLRLSFPARWHQMAWSEETLCLEEWGKNVCSHHSYSS